MRRLKDLQKRKYDTSLLLVGVHDVRMEPGIRTGATLEPSNDNTRLDTDEDVDDTILKRVCYFPRHSRFSIKHPHQEVVLFMGA